jgi:hypothetical protein
VIYEGNSLKKGFENPLSSTGWQIYQENLLKNNPQTHEDLEKNLEIAIAHTHKHQLKLGLEIILILLSHPQKDVRAFSLGKLYPLTTDETLRELIIKDLKDIRNDPQLNISIAAQNSLDCISGIVHNLVLADIISEAFVEFSVDLEKYGLTTAIHFQTPFSPHHLEGQSSFFNSKNKYIVALIRLYRQINVLLDKILFSKQLEELFPELKDMEEVSMGNFLEEGVIPYSDISNFEWNPTDSLEKLAQIYAHTFMENRHLHRLKTYLDDDNYQIRKIGVNALIDVATFLLNCQNEKSKEKETPSPEPHQKINLPSLAKLCIIHFFHLKDHKKEI